MRKLVYYVGMSVDGYIAGPADRVDDFPVTQDVVDLIVEEYPDTLPTHVRAQLGVDVPNPNFAVVVQGRATYEAALKVGITSPYTHLRQYVVSESLGRSEDPAVEVIAADVVERIRELKAEESGAGGDIYLAGGGRLAGTLLPEIDSLVVKLYPVVLGTGVPLFRAGFSPTHFTLRGTRPLENGVVALTYDRR
ncbi:dihydrofolate reductase family protein [Nocardiopsis sp. EMB25]|uniref:dihydrofolate reductase family protein n=1 Tax=Nocardiopsis TaxID=2013 RepID=UPI00034CEFB0|nr:MULTISPECIES: dihydrofolate reductase family protein [Nocardiopsis]MCY9787179.1 dihydrofolate reductase family protein [Nocardiopsis sp. EMB25]